MYKFGTNSIFKFRYFLIIISVKIIKNYYFLLPKSLSTLSEFNLFISKLSLFFRKTFTQGILFKDYGFSLIKVLTRDNVLKFFNFENDSGNDVIGFPSSHKVFRSIK